MALCSETKSHLFFFPTTEIRIHCSENSLESLGVSEGKEIGFCSCNKKNSFSL